MMKAISSLCLHLIFVVCYRMGSIHCAMNNSPGETHPLRVEMKINSNANITCRMNLTKFGNNVNSSSLYFVEEDTGRRAPEADTEIINENTIVFHLRNAKEQERNYVCKSGELAIGVTHVVVGTPPVNVTDFKCRGYDYTYMVCNFTVPHNFIPTKYNLFYSAVSANYIQTCTMEMQEYQAICNLTLDQNNYRTTHEYFNFTLEITNDLGKHEQNFWINHYESVIPAKPVYIFEKITNDSVIIKWYNPKYSSYAAKGLQYEIRLRPKDRGVDWINHTDFVARNNRSEFKLHVRNIPYAYFRYELSVRIRVNKSSTGYDDSYWSEPYVQEFQTAACPPSAAPLTDVGSFYIDPAETTLRLYWHQLPEYRENGPNFQYILKQIKVGGLEVDENFRESIQINRISAVLPWNKTQRYEFVIKSSNAEGESPDNSTITIPAWSERHEGTTSPLWIRNVYDAENHIYTLSWNAPRKLEGLIDYTVFWCQSKKATPNDCEGTVNFEHVSKNTSVFKTKPQREDKNLNMAVSANYHDFNSGMHWMCAADGTSDLPTMELEIYSISARNITVKWRSDHVCPSLLEGYSFTYCRLRQDFNNAEKSVCSDPITGKLRVSAKELVIRGLDPFSTYKIEMLMFSKFKPGKMSEPLIIKTAEDAPSKPLQLKAHNITSNSAVLTWISPERLNGVLRKYRIQYNNENYIIDCLQNKTICSKGEMRYTLENLSSFTRYKVYVVAYTIAASNSSNDITLDTLVGIPSNPRHIRTKEKTQNTLQWSVPEVPSGRVEFYEVSIEVLYKDTIQRQHISKVLNATECVYHFPVCIDADYRFKLHVRAVNVARRDSEIDQYILATMNKTNDDMSLVSESIYYEQNEDLKCEVVSNDLEKQMELIKHYSNVDEFVQYKSVWSVGPVTNCSDTKLSRVTMLALLVVVSSLGVMAAFYVARKKYQKMANITCALPPGLEAISYPVKNDGNDFRRSKDSFYNNESRHLLSSISHDSGYTCHSGDHNHMDGVGGGGIDGLTTGSLGKSSGYMGSNHSTQYCNIDVVNGQGGVAQQRSGVDDAYMVMELLKPSENNSPQTTFDNSLSTQSENVGSYVQPTFNAITGCEFTQSPHSFLPTENGYITQISGLNSTPQHETQIIPSENGYVKPHNILNWPAQKFSASPSPIAAMPTVVPTTKVDVPVVNSSGYVAPQMLQKPLIHPANSNGYTSLEALGKSPQVFTTANGGGTAPGGAILPPISGYVTQKELSAFGQQHQFN
ncbi:cytokine receptor-like isoform X2 [Haematobia irritans]|uniref:cytokine receptor-like isoform X2 n=1 Tax=Haematobia irritans TaxID=7368 RepID=UPI003F502703